MKINVRHEAATAENEPEGSEATPDRTCVWVVGDDGETQDTKYIEGGGEVAIDVSFAVTQQARIEGSQGSPTPA